MKGPYARLSKESWSSQGDSPDSLKSSSSSSCSSSSDVEEGKCKEVEDMQKFLQAETLGMIGGCLEKSPDKVLSPVSLDSLLMPPPCSPAAGNGSAAVSVGHGKVTPCSPGLGLKETVEEYMRPAETKEGSDGESLEYGSGDELDITGIDDIEIDSYLMTPAETKSKTKMWMKVNKEYLAEQVIKMKRAKEDREEMIKNGLDPDKKKKIYKKRRNDYGTAIEAIEKVAEEKKMSTKINYDVLKNLSFGSPKSSAASAPAKSANIFEDTKPTPFKPAFTSLKRLQTFEDGLSKKMKVEKKPNLLPRFSSRKSVLPTSSSDVTSAQGLATLADTKPVIESGPVAPDPEDDMSDLSEEEEPLLSAAELLSQQFGGGDAGGWGEEEDYY